MTDFDAKLIPYLDDAARVTRWPARSRHKADQDIILQYLTTKFALNQRYTEREVNDLLKQWHTFADWALLRRELYSRGYLNRHKDGSAYWRV
ncbi:MAG: DUF2087 domain-containing protein [Chloroflexota bacterium]